MDYSPKRKCNLKSQSFGVEGNTMDIKYYEHENVAEMCDQFFPQIT